MTQEYAQEISAKYLETSKTLCVTSDGAIYIDNDIEDMKEHAKTNNVEIFIFKGEKEIEKVSEGAEIVEVKKQSKKTKING